MNTKEVGEIRRRIRRDRSNMTGICGCYVNDNGEIISSFRQSTALMSENEAEKYFGLLKRSLSGRLGKNLIDICFRTSQVAGSEEHKLLMDLRETELKDEDVLRRFYEKVTANVHLDTGYLILIGFDRYDVPFKSRDDETQSDASDQVYAYLLCAVCPVKQTKAALRYQAETKEFHDGGVSQVVVSPELGFLFPAFDNRATNIYNALYYCHSAKDSHEAFADAIFHTDLPKPAAEQKKSFEALLSQTLEEECSMEVVQAVHDQLRQCMEIHKESHVPEPLLVSKEQIKEAMTACGVSEGRVAKFGIDYDEVFGFEAELHPENIIDSRRFEVQTPDVSIKVSPERADLLETRTIGGVKYILINAEEDVEVNGVRVHIAEPEKANV